MKELIKVLETDSKSSIDWLKTNDMVANLGISFKQ